MRVMISRNAARYSGRALRSGRMSAPGIEQRQKARRAQWAALEPAIEHRHVARAGMQALRQRKEPPPIAAACAREHDGKAGHEETRPCARPTLRIQVAGRAQLDQTILVRALETRGEMAVSRRVRRCLLEHAQARTNGPCQRLRSEERRVGK